MASKVLIVEDEFITANALRLLLEQHGHTVQDITSSAHQAEQSINSHTPDLVLLDIHLEGKESGIDLARKLKNRNIAFIFLSANSSQKILEEAKKTEPYGFLVKPFREKDLLAALEIASYRHRINLEFKSLQEELLQKQLKQIVLEISSGEQKLLHIAKAIQPHIPFDLIVFRSKPPHLAHIPSHGYLRIGFNEYQFISEKEALTITGLKNNALFETNENTDLHNIPTIYEFEKINSPTTTTILQKMLLKTFKITSYLVFPITVSKRLQGYYFFCSRKPDTYTQNHISLLAGLELDLSISIERKSNSISQPFTLPNYAAAAIQDRQEVILPAFKSIIGSHPLLLTALDLTAQVAPYNTSVLILGESGTGKEKIAECVHLLSTRKEGPFVKVNCAAIPASLIESELFGHEKGAFTGADEKRKGKFEQADGGTIFLDEIGELSLEMQVRLLRVLQEKEINIVGNGVPKKVDIRIVAATNRNLEKEVAAGNFRLDLYYRLNVFPITMPPLRERKSDIEALSLYFAQKFCKEFNKEFMGIAANMNNEMQGYQWPGNIRELENILERSVILNDGKSELALKQSLVAAEAEVLGRQNIETLEDVKNIQRETEKKYIISVLKKVNGKIRGTDGAAALLNLKPTTLESKMAKLGICKDDF